MIHPLQFPGRDWFGNFHTAAGAQQHMADYSQSWTLDVCTVFTYIHKFLTS